MSILQWSQVAKGRVIAAVGSIASDPGRRVESTLLTVNVPCASGKDGGLNQQLRLCTRIMMSDAYAMSEGEAFDMRDQPQLTRDARPTALAARLQKQNSLSPHHISSAH